jgi:hypothetical protein
VAQEISKILIALMSGASSLKEMIGVSEAVRPIIRCALVSYETNLKWMRKFRQVILTVNFVSSPRYPSKVYAG